MTRERLVMLLAHGAVAVILATLVVSAFTLPPRSALRAFDVVVSERAAAVARHTFREPETAIASVAIAGEAIEDMLVAPVPADVPAPVVVAPVDSATSAETTMLALMNASRTAAGLVALTLDASVSETARSHSDVESRYGYVYHDGPDGSARARDASACATGWYGENTGKVWNENVRALHVEFMSEPWEPINHRTNIMDPAFRRVGIGAVVGRDAMYMTMVFCR